MKEEQSVDTQTNAPDNKKLPPVWLSLIPIATLVALLFITIHIFGSDALGGGSQISLIIAAAVTSILAMGYSKISWETIEEHIGKNVQGIASALVILLLIGALSGSWMVSGVIPTLIYYGMQIMSPEFFLPCCCVICAIVSVMTGSSWTTIATIGVALMGIGHAQGFTDGWIAGAIISGAYFGDKMSALSDTTVLSAATTDTPLFKHIRYMMLTTVPSMVITLIVFTVAGLFTSTVSSVDTALFTQALEKTYNISPWLMLVPLAAGVMIAKKVPSLITLFSAAVIGSIAALIAQPDILLQVAGKTGELSGSALASALFEGSYITLFGSTNIPTGLAALDDLVSTSGMAGMMDTLWLIVCAMCFGATLTASGMLESLMRSIRGLMANRFGLVSTTVGSGIFMNVCTADQYISIFLVSRMFGDVYKKQGYESRLLSRTIEDGVTVTSPLVPWSTCGMTQATILGVATIVYLPYCIFNLISPIMTIFVTTIGYKVFKTKQD